MKVIVHLEIDDAARSVMARALGNRGLATRAQIHALTESLLSAWLLEKSSAQYVKDAESWRRGQPRVKPEPEIVRNSAHCDVCDTEIVSKHRHDFVWCPCQNIAVDGGNAYLRRVGGEKPWHDTSVKVAAP